MAPIGKIWSYPNNPRVAKALIAAKYNGVQVDVEEVQLGVTNKSPEFLAKFPLGKVPVFEAADGFTLYESNAIAYYVAASKDNTQLLGSSKKEAARIQQFIALADNELAPAQATWIFPILGWIPLNEQNTKKAIEDTKKVMDVLNKHLLTRTFLVGENVTLADIAVSTALLNFYRLVFDASFRAPYKNVTRWFTTCINQPFFHDVIGPVALCEKAQVAEAPKAREGSASKKEAKKEVKKEAPKKEEKKAAAKKKEDDDEEDESYADEKPKGKNPLDLLEKSPFVLDEWKRFYSNNDTRPTACNWFWEHYDPNGYGIWRVDYKYNSELTKTFMSANLVGGFFQRLESARKYAFGSLCILGEDNANVIAGYFVFRGTEIPFEVKDSPDFESFNFVKVNDKDPNTRKLFESYIAWDEKIEGKKFADGSVITFLQKSSFVMQIEDAELAWNEQEFAEALNEKRTLLENGLDSFKPPSNASKSKVESGNYDNDGHVLKLSAEQISFILKLSEHLQLDQQQSADVLLSCIRDELETPMFQTRHPDEKVAYDDRLLQVVTAYYFEVRRDLLLLFNALLRASENEHHPYYDQIKAFVPCLINDTVIRRLLRQLLKAVGTRIPSHVESSEIQAMIWAKEYLLEQIALLEILFLIYYDMKAYSGAEVLWLIKELNKVRFGLDQANAPLLIDELSRTLCDEVAHVCGLLVSSLLDLDNNVAEDVWSNAVSSPDILDEITAIFAKYATSEFESSVMAMILLSWGTFIQEVISKEANFTGPSRPAAVIARVEQSSKFIAAAVSLQVFDYLRKATQLHAPEDVMAIAYRSVTKNLMTSFIANFSVGDSLEFNSIIECLVHIYAGSPGIIQQFWLQDYPIADRRSALDAAKARFPLESRPLLKLLTSLSGDVTTATYVFRYLKNLGSFTGVFDGNFIERLPDGSFRLRFACAQVAQAAELRIMAPAGAPVRILSEKPIIARATFQYSAFHLFFSLIDGYLNGSDTDFDPSSCVSKELMKAFLPW
ncbi:Elongation factor 1-gamma [Irineochytrium annulatum]|nr:Elongation factor 1-gamma [Irineochytrium annulatum]